MAKAKQDTLTLKVSIAGDTTYDGDIVAYTFKRNGAFVDRSTVKAGKVTLPFSADDARARKVLFGPVIDGDGVPTMATLRRLSAFEAVLTPGQLIERVVIPSDILTLWPLCFCWVTGRVLKNGQPVCDAIVHACEVDAIFWLQHLADRDLFRLRDDLITQLRRPPELDLPRPGPEFSVDQPALDIDRVAFNPQPDPPIRVASAALSTRQLPPAIETLPADVLAGLTAGSASILRATLIERFQIFYPFLCLTPYWWRYRCDEIGTRTTDANGRFTFLVPYNCNGDKPDIYVWVEFPVSGVIQTVYRPPVRCNTYWNYTCGTDIIVNITDPRVPACDPNVNLDGCIVAVMSIGPGISVDDVQANGLTTSGAPFGGTLEPRVDFGRADLIAKGITHYRWSYRRLSGPDGVSPDVGTWLPLTRDVYRHYRVFVGGVLSYPSDRMGPDAAGPAANTFRIQPLNPPAPGDAWINTNEHIDQATGYFETRGLPGTPASPTAGDDLAAGQYELKLELFAAGSAAPIEFEPNGVELKVTDMPAPFPTGEVSTMDAPEPRRIRNGAGHTVAFRMVLRVDNNYCQAEVFAASGSATDCGIINADGSSTIELGFRARHANGFANYSHSVERGDGANVAIAATSGVTGAADPNGFVQAPPFDYRRNFIASGLLDTCPQAAFAQVIDVDATATNGYSRIGGYDRSDVGAFALVSQCPPCDCDD